MQLNERNTERARAAEARAYIGQTAALTEAVQAYRNGLDRAPWADDFERTREEWHRAQDALDIVLLLNGEPARTRPCTRRCRSRNYTPGVARGPTG